MAQSGCLAICPRRRKAADCASRVPVGARVTQGRVVDPFKEEDEGYVAARGGLSLTDNPYPPGTIRNKEWRTGWLIGRSDTGTGRNDGPREMEHGGSPADNPYPRGTIRHRQWRLNWHARRRENERDVRLTR
jgi:hypothetical protein